MENPNTGNTLQNEQAGANVQKRIIAIRRASPNGGISCPKCDGELVLTIDRGTHLAIHECLSCGYFED